MGGSWAQAMYIKTGGAALQGTEEEKGFIEDYLPHFQPSARVMQVMHQAGGVLRTTLDRS